MSVVSMSISVGTADTNRLKFFEANPGQPDTVIWSQANHKQTKFRTENFFKNECINFLTWHNGGKYFVDYFIEGPIDEIYNIWDIKKLYDDYSEKITTENIFSLGYTNFNFMLDSLSDENEIYWIKYNLNLSTYKQHSVYTTEIIK